eukprot:5608339-Ditylum_brightwellii.AAC.1
MAIQSLQKGVRDMNWVMFDQDLSNCSNKQSLQDVVDCIDFLDTIEFNNDGNSIGVDLDAVNENLIE